MWKQFVDRMLKPGTRALWREGRRTPGYGLYDFLHGYIYGRCPYLYIGLGKGDHPWSDRLAPLWRVLGAIRVPFKSAPVAMVEPTQPSSGTFADVYHGKVLPLDSARRLVLVQEDISIGDLEQVLPYPRARDLVLKNPDHIVALECPCRAGRPDPCLPLDVCLIVGEPFASFILEHHPGRSRQVAAQEAAQILEAEHARGHVHHAFFKDAMLGRFYAICNCCSCCCGAMHAHRNGTPMLASSGYLAQVEQTLCLACEDCALYCQFGALTLEWDSIVVDEHACMGCGVCVDICQQDALQLVRAPSKGEPLEICELMSGLGYPVQDFEALVPAEESHGIEISTD